MSNISLILERLRLKPKDTLTLAEIQEIFLNLNVKEISELCRISSKFNIVCKRESLWRNKVKSEYGVYKSIRGKTWRETARIFFMGNMINLGKIWVNGMTYKELLEEADNRGQESLLYLYTLKNEYVREVLDIRNDTVSTDHFFSGSLRIPDLLSSDFYGDEDEDKDKIAKVLTKELGVVAAAVAGRYYSYPEAPASEPLDRIRDLDPRTANYTDEVRKKTDLWSVMIDELFDYTIYLLSYSDINDELTLYNIIYPEVGT